MSRGKRGAPPSCRRARAAAGAPIALLYIRHPGAELRDLDIGLRTIVDRFAPLVELSVVSPEGTPARFAQFAARTPVVLVLRHGQLVGEAIGAFLPVRELDRVVRCAVEWSR